MATEVAESIQKDLSVISEGDEKQSSVTEDCEMSEVDKENVRSEEMESDQSLGRKRKCDEMGDSELGKSQVLVTRTTGGEVIMEEETASMGSFEEVNAEDQLEVEDVLDELGEDSVESGEETLLQDSDGVIAFKMSLQKRLNELHDAFENFGQGGLTLSNFWTLYFETYVEPMGWKALWKQMEDAPAEKGSMTFKAVETVEVVQVNCANLSARVLREDRSSVSVPINELYPLAHQDNSFLSMKVTAKCIDNYRFFLNHLLFPWDSENADRWAELHLESRIQFYYDLQSGAISETMSTEVKNLIREAKLNQVKIDELEEKLEGAESEEDVDEDLIAEMLPIHMRQQEIKGRLQMLENPLWRNILNKHKILKNRTTGRIKEKVIVVTGGFTAEEMKENLDFIISRVPKDEKIRFVDTLQDALERCEANSKVFVTSGVHKVSGLNNFEEGGSITGLSVKGQDPIVIEPKDAGDVWLVANAETEVSLENLNVRVTNKWQRPCGADEQEILPKEAASSIAFLVLRGGLKLKNVKIEGFVGENGIGADDQDTVGVKAVEQGTVSIDSCEITSFTTGLVIREQAQLSMTGSKIFSCENGIETNPGQPFKISSSVIEKCQKFGIVIYTQVETKSQIGGLDILQNSEATKTEFQVTDVTIGDCIAGSVCICSENESVLEHPEEQANNDAQ